MSGEEIRRQSDARLQEAGWLAPVQSVQPLGPSGAYQHIPPVINGNAPGAAPVAPPLHQPLPHPYHQPIFPHHAHGDSTRASQNMMPQMPPPQAGMNPYMPNMAPHPQHPQRVSHAGPLQVPYHMTPTGVAHGQQPMPLQNFQAAQDQLQDQMRRSQHEKLM